MADEGKSPFTRRQFLETASAISAGVALGNGQAATVDEKPCRMKYRRFGRTGLRISEIGLGCASGLRSEQLGPSLFNRYREELPAIVHKLLELGGNFVATSPRNSSTCARIKTWA
jgi:hypothetical protein